SYALYGHAEYDFTDKLELAVGGRYTMDRRQSIDRRPATAGSARARYNRFNYDAALTYAFDSDVKAYARYATGYQSGGVIKGVTFRPEDNKTAEIGIKSEFFDRRVRLNAAAFRTRIKDQQRAQVILPQGLVIQNVGRVKIEGIEAELSVSPVEGLTLSGNFGYNNPRNTQDDFNLAPKTTFAYNAQYQTPEFGSGMYMLFETSGDYRGKSYGQGLLNRRSANVVPGFNLPPAVYAGFPSQQAYLNDVFAKATIGDYWLMNARVSLMAIPLASGKARVSGFVRNLTDSKGRNYAVNVNTNIQTAYERPRTYGLELGVEF
ncbi:MAG: TonB-dependent receptor, partial [Alphaproteobacteria bacterium]